MNRRTQRFQVLLNSYRLEDIMATNLGPILPLLTAAEWATRNPVLVKGQLVQESDTKALKVGDGSTRYSDLAYAGVSMGSGGSAGYDGGIDE